MTIPKGYTANHKVWSNGRTVEGIGWSEKKSISKENAAILILTMQRPINIIDIINHFNEYYEKDIYTTLRYLLDKGILILDEDKNLIDGANHDSM